MSNVDVRLMSERFERMRQSTLAFSTWRVNYLHRTGVSVQMSAQSFFALADAQVEVLAMVEGVEKCVTQYCQHDESAQSVVVSWVDGVWKCT